ncbi:DNA-directed RNA polymerase-like subunit [Grosmannia clavigera kw1407]|uniref:DNA-directed RNA polymerase-like subunit n=1 Tax=Grosmannia clavigera (strain kw1407 / UAMH 11150) TaxID=655863 RepID=F0XLM2_GROCL|nr:DNA-directed RNA polymerase-like subunit [Grosmannia clavigera kw1407]EFX01393.1 DNA-directed RNA polymerase-like subunit [Grosmannia clavigera kw1407]
MPPRTRRVLRGGATPAANSDDTSGQGSPAAALEPTAASEAAGATEASEASTLVPTRTAGSRSFKLRPKVVRRADEERKALAEQEEKKLLDRAAVDDARRRRESRMRGGRGRGRGGRGRGRGDFAGGRDGLIRRTVAPDGPFSQMPGSLSQGRGRPGQGGFGGGGGGGGGGGFGGGGRGSGPSSGGFLSVSGPAVEVDLRLNTDMFNGRMADYADGDDVAVKDEFAAETISSTSSGKKIPQLLPMGIKREEFRETGMVVAATDELEATAGEGDAVDDGEADDSGSDLFIGNGDVTTTGGSADDDEVWSRAIKTQRGVKLIGPDGQEIEVTDIDTLAEKRQEIAAAAAAAGQRPSGEEGEEGGISSSSGVVKTKKRRPQKEKEKDPEEVMVEEGLQAMLHDLAIDPPRDSGTAPLAIHSNESAADDEEERRKQQESAEAPQREGRLFLFQFPPVLPSLQPFQPSSPTIKNSSHVGGVVKPDPDEHSDVVMLDSVPAAAAVDLTGSGDNSNDNDGRKPSDIGEGGFLGTLTIRKSGRAELSWGGMTYEMMPGSDVQFLTTAVLLEEADEKPNVGDGQPTENAGGNAFGMGPVGGKYNLVPVFSSETEWTVDPAELEMYEDEDEDEEDEEDEEEEATVQVD